MEGYCTGFFGIARIPDMSNFMFNSMLILIWLVGFYLCFGLNKSVNSPDQDH